jgi:4-hydroxy-tetrahydrodipicolinate reductase
LSDGSHIRRAWSGTVHAVADRMGIKLEELRVFFDTATHDKTHQTLWGPVEAGTVAAVRFGIEGIYKGKPFIILEHINRSTLEAAPHWPKMVVDEGASTQHQYTVLIKGNPDLSCRMDFGFTREKADAGLVVTAMLVVNAAPSVVEHAPGIIDEMDLPLYTGKNIVV